MIMTNLPWARESSSLLDRTIRNADNIYEFTGEIGHWIATFLFRACALRFGNLNVKDADAESRHCMHRDFGFAVCVKWFRIWRLGDLFFCLFDSQHTFHSNVRNVLDRNCRLWYKMVIVLRIVSGALLSCTYR